MTMIYNRYEGVRGTTAPEAVCIIEYTIKPGTADEIIPFEITTERSVFDVEWCRRDGRLCFHCSGAGRFYRRFEPCNLRRRSQKTPLWYDRERVKIGLQSWRRPHLRENLIAKRPDAYLKALGYQPLDEPIRFDGVVNPFDHDDWQAFDDSPTEYCRKCDDWLPTNDCWSDWLCGHVFYCEDCGMWSGPGKCKGDRCEHRKPVRERAS